MRRTAALAVAVLVLTAACSGTSSSTDPTAPGTSTTTTAVGSTTSAPATTTAATSTTATATTTTTLPATTSTTVPIADVVIEDVTISEEGADPNYRVSAIYPRITGLPDAGVAAAINGPLETMATGAVAEFLGWIEGTDDYGFGNELSLGYETTLLGAGVASFRFSHYTYFDGAAHGSVALSTAIFDLNTGRSLGLPDLLVGDSAPVALAILAGAAIIDDVYRGDAAEFQSFVADTAQLDVSRFALRPAGIEVSFDQYEVGPGALGPVTVLIPYEELGVLINPQGPIPGIRG